MDQDPLNLDLPEAEEREGFPWALVLVVTVVVAILAAFIYHATSGSGAAAAALEIELKNDKAVLDAERDKVFVLTEQLEVKKRAITQGIAPNRAEAVKEYNRLVAAQRSQRERVKTLADLYNEKVSKLHELQ